MSSAQLPPVPVAGMFTDMRYDAASGDVLGMEVFIVSGGGRCQAVVQCAGGELASMWTHNEEGLIIWRVVVNSAGIADTSTFRVVRSSNPLLVDAMRATLPYLRFSPDVFRPPLVVEPPRPLYTKAMMTGMKGEDVA